MARLRHWSLGAKLMLVGAPFLLLVFISTVATLWVSWQLDGGAAAVNEAGRMRMQSYRMSLAIGTGETRELSAQAREFDRSLSTLRHGDPERPLFVAWDDTSTARFAVVEQDWAQYQKRWIEGQPAVLTDLRAQTVTFASHIDAFVNSIETHIAKWTALLHLLQVSMLALVILGAAVLLYTGYLFVLEPVGQLKQAIDKIQSGNFDARVERVTTDEFGTLADGFNNMAAHLQSMYQNLESKVAEKTAQLQEKTARLESLYEVTALVSNATSLESLAQGFTKSVARIAHADGVALRWSNQANQRHLMLAAHGLPVSMVDAEHCIYTGDCHCGAANAQALLNVIPIRNMANSMPQHCARAGFETVVTLPVRLHERLMGEVDLFFHARVNPTVSERSLLEALSSHLASGMENLRLNALDMEAAVSQERHLLARELHDSIAQSLAFLKIQVQLMRDAIKTNDPVQIANVLEEIDIGVRESYGDVRELLLHFRTRTNAEDIEPALATTLRKFEHQSGIKATFAMQGQGMPLSPELQIQVLHIVQEALSNVRKHAHASQVWLDVQQLPAWRFEVRDDGIGFEPDTDALDETHVGLRIMVERSQRIGAELDVLSKPSHGSSIILTLPRPSHPIAIVKTVAPIEA
ncbi:MAG: type IV pili methyl-accepting chemotaxis transducer N-terminal domain-containing protein [Gammaproteobacteria bacterium]|uniref:type IV pili methyl-accepting chemotaxis transducer N-terminal domain-containing protein n=1 Tax=Rhodoferax sp. TaxID=50421 RepID=UPI001791EA08|nr:type IV pili methyl-accepting chemotaxis transducer N-terminal domain-containing protein [Rhodoferax sp.]MBU3899904.1 type IV pili methyl-accepting chemotaxis transducer N-terminal domain-containing protein [Gammaproteobacteria bacterium]MBA3057861.1 HAMP domain-containing protein [Rhodoferax sp.]MBU3996088.1 type IV pili methyl-accepting chemotaxis transducer N-terminal domain-containing protein [Gammaproteobacteria bacterium]MBU4019170.1 type IV pili methyl-accepting chemotaxis transducer 